jgi:hypothetical protein
MWVGEKGPSEEPPQHLITPIPDSSHPPIPLLEQTVFLIQTGLALVRPPTSMNVLLDPHIARKPGPAGKIRNF